jgi:opacity protein-like surface antigen
MKNLGRLRVLPVALLVIAFLVTPVVADTRKGGGDVGWDIGTTRLDDDIADANAFRMDVRAGYMLTNMFQIEGQIGWTDRHDLTLITGFANAVFNFRTSQRTMPYLLVGIGAARMDLASGDDTGGGLQAATGVKAFGEKGRMGLRLELGAMALDTFDEQTVNWNFTVGFVFDLGKHHGHKRNKPLAGTRASYYY